MAGHTSRATRELLRFHLKSGVRLAMRAGIPAAALLTAAVGLSPHPGATLRLVADDLASRDGSLGAGLILILVATGMATWAAPRISHGVQGWMRHLPAPWVAHRRALVGAILAAELPVALAWTALWLIAWAQGTDVSLHRLLALPPALIGIAIACAPTQWRIGTTLIGGATVGLALFASWPGWLVAVLLSALGERLVVPVAIRPPTGALWHWTSRAGYVTGVIAMRALGWRALKAYVSALLPLGAAWLFVRNNPGIAHQDPRPPGYRMRRLDRDRRSGRRADDAAAAMAMGPRASMERGGPRTPGHGPAGALRAPRACSERSLVELAPSRAHDDHRPSDRPTRCKRLAVSTSRDEHLRSSTRRGSFCRRLVQRHTLDGRSRRGTTLARVARGGPPGQGSGREPLVRSGPSRLWRPDLVARGLTTMIRLDGVRFAYPGGPDVVHAPALEIGPGLTLLLGPNGAGKSTLLRLIAGVERPREGTIRIAGHDLWQAEVEARQHLAYVPEQPELTPYATIEEIVRLVCRLRGVPERDAAQAIRSVGLADQASRSIRQLSQGQRRRAVFAAARIGRPGVLLLDEPLEAMDRAMRVEIVAWIRRAVGEGRTVVTASHEFDDLSDLASAALAVKQGKDGKAVLHRLDRHRSKQLETFARGESVDVSE